MLKCIEKFKRHRLVTINSSEVCACKISTSEQEPSCIKGKYQLTADINILCSVFWPGKVCTADLCAAGKWYVTDLSGTEYCLKQVQNSVEVCTGGNIGFIASGKCCERKSRCHKSEHVCLLRLYRGESGGDHDCGYPQTSDRARRMTTTIIRVSATIHYIHTASHHPCATIA